MLRVSKTFTLRKRRQAAIAAAVFATLPISAVFAETCSVSPTFVNWVTPGTLGLPGTDQMATLEWGSASSDLLISGPSFITDTETSIIQLSEAASGIGTFTINFDSPVVHDISLFFGNLGRTDTGQLQSAVIGDFNLALSGGSFASNLSGTVTPLDNQGYFSTSVSDTDGIASVSLSGTGGDGQPLDGRFWVHDPIIAPGDLNGGALNQAYGMVDLAYTPPAVVSGTSSTISTLDFRQVGVGVGPNAALGVQARIRSCIDATDNDFTASPIPSAAGGSTSSVLSDDNLNTETVSTLALLGNVDLAVVTPASPATGSVTLNTSTGEITVAPNTTPGTYAITYSLTDRPVGGVPSNTDTAVALVEVAAPVIAINAADDDFAVTPLNGLFGGTSGNAYANDTIGIVPVDAAAITPTIISAATPNNPGGVIPYLEIAGSDEGLVIVPPSTPAGLYFIEYEICEDINPTNCDQATISIGVLNGIGIDHGDAPFTYGSAFHNVPNLPDIYMGAVPPDTENTPPTTAGAQGDDNTDLDDEDGIIFPILTQGVSVSLSVDVIGTGLLQGWIDFDGNGVFDPLQSEQIAIDLIDDGLGDDSVAGDGKIQFEVLVPTDATTALTYARFRFSSQSALAFSGFAADGETEDFPLAILAAELVDRGDAPASFGDPRHAVVPEIYLGAGLPDTDVVANFSANADGDDLTDFDDEDGVLSFPVLTAGATASLTVATRETLGAANDLINVPALRAPGITNLQLWVDFNQDGVFSTAEHVAIDYRDGSSGDTDGVFNNSIRLDIPVPYYAANGQTYARLRWSTTSGVVSDPFDGFNADGEVEDYLITVVNTNPPLICDSGFYMIATETSSNLPTLSRLTATFDGTNYNLTQSELPPDYVGNYLVTGWGFNELDGYIYGVRQSPRSLMRIDANGATRDVADLSGLSIESPDTTTDILPNGVLIYKSASNNSLYQLLDISDPSNPVALGVLDAGSGAPYGRDMAYNPADGMLYFFDPARNLYMLDPNGGVPGTTTVTLVQANVPLAPGKSAMDMDSVWFDQQGYIYGFDNQSRQVFALEIGTDGNRPASYDFIEVQGTISNITYQGNDGASCRGPGPFAPILGSISGTVYEDVNGSDALDSGEPTFGAGIAITLYSDNGTPLDQSDDTFVATADTLANGTYEFQNLAALTYRIELDTTDSDIPPGYAIGTTNPITGVVVVDGVDTINQNFGFDVAASEADLSITKTATSVATGLQITTAQAGDVIDFTITVSNAGPVTATGVEVIDLLPRGFTYASDDAAANGDTYDLATGLWTVGDVVSGTPEVLTIRVTMNASGSTTNTAEIVASDQADPDSDPDVGVVVDDLSDGLADDDEARITVALQTGARLLSGRIFVDNGTGGGTAYDAQQNGTEVGTENAVLSIFDAGGTLLAKPTIAANGRWSFALDAAYSGALTLQTSPLPGALTVSEATTGLPSLIDADPHDGTYTFTPDANSDYTALDFGIAAIPDLTQDQEATVEPGQVVQLLHDFRAFSSGVTTFSIVEKNMSPAGAFAVALYRDIDCNGTADVALNDPVTVDAGDRICLITRISSNGGLAPTSSFTYKLQADTTLTGTTISSRDTNSDRIMSGGAEGRMELYKTVRNETQATPEGASNAGAIGDVLTYRIYMSNPSPAYANNVKIYDRTPAYTELSEPVSTPITVSASLSCNLTEPASNIAGYTGALRWDCTGALAPGDDGAVSFRVRITP